MVPFRATNPNLWRVRVGEHHLLERNTAQDDVMVSQLYRHASYNSTSQDYDIALLRLADPVTFKPEVLPVCLPGRQDTADEGMLCVATGWGSTQGSHNITSPAHLSEHQISHIHRMNCRTNMHD